MLTGPGPQWATGGDTETERLGSEASGKLRVSPGTVNVRFTCTTLEAILHKPFTKKRIKMREKQNYNF